MVIEYADLECPYCAKAHLILRELRITRVFRHFPVTSKHPRARVPHLWERAERMDMDLDRFEADRRSAEVAERVERDFHSGIRAGVASTPTQFLDGGAHPGVPDASFRAALRSST